VDDLVQNDGLTVEGDQITAGLGAYLKDLIDEHGLDTAHGFEATSTIGGPGHMEWPGDRNAAFDGFDGEAAAHRIGGRPGGDDRKVVVDLFDVDVYSLAEALAKSADMHPVLGV